MLDLINQYLLSLSCTTLCDYHYGDICALIARGHKVEAIKMLRNVSAHDSKRPISFMIGNSFAEYLDAAKIYSIEKKYILGLKQAKDVVEMIALNEPKAY